MSAILYDAKDIGSLAYNVGANNELRDAFPIVEDRLNSQLFKSFDNEVKRIYCFFDRLYMANQLAYYYSYADDCASDGSFTLARLEYSDCKPNGVFCNKPVHSDLAMWAALTTLRYNIVTNGGNSFFSEADCERLDNLINSLACNLIRRD